MPKIKVIGQMVQIFERPQTDGRTDGQTDGQTDATKRIIALASRSIMNEKGKTCAQMMGLTI